MDLGEGEFTDAQKRAHEERCPTCGGRMDVDFEPVGAFEDGGNVWVKGKSSCPKGCTDNPTV